MPNPAGYAPETCALCGGLGKAELFPNEPCAPCKGTGKVLVWQPPIRCPRCGGSGKAGPFRDSVLYPRCIICRGAGWVMALVD
jgi:DnaJ-class molecular chaperone